MVVRVKTVARLSKRGLKLLSLSVTLSILAALFEDPIILVAAIILLIIPVHERLYLQGAVKNLERLLKMEPKRIEETVNAGKAISRSVKIECSSDLPMEIIGVKDKGLRIGFKPEEIGEGTSQIEIEIYGRLAGEYVLDKLGLKVRGRLNLFENSVEFPYEIRIKVYPRVMKAATVAVRYILSQGGVGYGEKPIALRGAGLEYAESRKYVPGDPLRRMDWKATARLGRLIVKEYNLDGGVGNHITFEASAPDPISADELATSFLNATVAVVQQGAPVGLTVHDGKEIICHTGNLSPKDAVALALRHALRIVGSKPEDLYSILEPKTSADLKRVLEETQMEKLRRTIRIEMEILKDLWTKPYEALRKIIDQASERFQLIIVSSLSGNPIPILELRDSTERKGSGITILQPTKPWENCEGLEEAYKLYERYSRINRNLQKRGIKVISSLNSLLK